MVEDAKGFCGWDGIDSIEGTDSGQLGWYLRSDRWGRGYATEATRLLLAFGFSALDRATMWATADPDNLASLRVLERSGLTNRGLTRPGTDVEGSASQGPVHDRSGTMAQASEALMSSRSETAPEQSP